MHIVVLGGTNNKNKVLDNYTKERCDRATDIISNLNSFDVKIHLSGGMNEKFNKSNTNHSEICKNYILSKVNFKNFILHSENNSTVDEAINFGKYFKNISEEILIISNDWHIERVTYLFNKTFRFYNISNFKFISIESNNLELKEQNKVKVNELINKPYGIWKDWLVNNYYEKFVTLRLVEKNDTDGITIVNMRNENNKYFFNTDKFYWESFKNIFYEKYFSNEIPPYFIILEDDIVGFIGCKTTKPNINDIGIMMFKKYQSKGIGKISLKKFVKIFNEKYNINKNKTIVSQILKTNIGSYKIFVNNCFKLDENKSTEENYYLTYNIAD